MCNRNKFLKSLIPEIRHTAEAVTSFASTVKDPRKKSQQPPPPFAPAPAEGLGSLTRDKKTHLSTSHCKRVEYWTFNTELHQKPEKFAEPNQFTKRFLFDCRARVKSLKSRGWHPWKKKKKKGMHWTHAFVFFWSLFVEGLYMEEEVVGSENQPQVISHTHARTHICSVFKRNV